MIIRSAAEHDLAAIMACYAAGIATMRANGNDQQWGNGYPNERIALKDIDAGRLVVATDDDGRILGCMSFIPGPDPTYAVIEEGAWPDDGPYHVVHRIAVRVPEQGVGSALMRWACEHAHSVRVDTHEVNAPMRSLLERLGFTYCGVIHLEDGSPRFAYQIIS